MAEQKLPDKAQENEMKREKVRVVPIKYIDDSPDHPFQVRDDEEMMSLVSMSGRILKCRSPWLRPHISTAII